MVYIRDEGSEFDAPVDFVWRYIFGGEDHDSAHKTTRNPTFKRVSDITLEYGSERLLRGTWTPDRLRITMVEPIAVTTEWLEGILAGSRFVYLYSPKGEKTRIDVYGEFTSPTLPTQQVEAVAREFLDGEFRDDAPTVRASYEKAKATRHGPR